MKNLLNEYYGLKEVRNFNKKIYLFKEETNYNYYGVSKLVERYVKLINIRPPYEEADSYAKGSKKRNDIISENKRYNKISNILNTILKKEIVMEEFYPSSLTITKWSFDTTCENEYEDEIVKIVFYTTRSNILSFKQVLITNFNNLLLPCEKLVDKFIEEYDYSQSMLKIYSIIESLNDIEKDLHIKYRDIGLICNIFDVIIFNGAFGNIHITHDGNTYYNHDIIKLIKNAREALKVKWIDPKTDKYVVFRNNYLDWIKEGYVIEK